MNNNYRLQLRHGDETKNFVTRNDVLIHINGQMQYGGVSLLPYEPVLFYYGENGNKNAIIMVGLPEGDTHNGKSYFIIDTADLKEEINAIDGKYDTAINALQEEDGKLLDAINKEKEDRIDANETEIQARSEKDAELEKSITDETEARKSADETLKSAVDYAKADLMSVIEACGLVYNDKLVDDRVYYEPDIHDEVIRDSNDITDAIDKISKFAQKMAKDLNIKVANTDTVKLNLEQDEKNSGGTITADVKIAGTEGLSKKNYDNNIIGKTAEGVYASVSLEPSTTNPNKLIFTTSGYVNGIFQVDAFETEVDLTAYKGDNGKNTGVTVNVDTTENKISAQLNLSSDNNNILKLKDGEYIVEGTSKNITYKDGTVFSALNKQSNSIEEIEDAIEFIKEVDVKPSDSDTVSVTVDKSSKGDFVVGANVKLSNDKSIIVSNGGLKADVSASFKKGTSTLFINVGNNEYAIDLSDLAVSVLKSATYDASTEELVLEFIVGDTTKTIRIPVRNLIHDVEVDDTDTVDMTLKTVAGGPNHISAEVKVDKTHSDNIITITSNGLYVSKAYITEAVKDEATERKEADNELKLQLAEISQLADDNKDAIKNEATTARAAEKANADAIAQEVKDARAAEKVNADAIAENKTAVKANEIAIGAEEGRAKAAEQANATAITAEETRAMAAELKNANSIDAEITRATAAEGANTSAINAEKERAMTAEEANKTEIGKVNTKVENISAEVKANTTSIANVVRDLAAEVSRSTVKDTEIENNLTETQNALNTTNANVAANTTSIANVVRDLAAEVSRSTVKDTDLESEVERALNAAANANTNSDKANAGVAEVKQNLTNEITRATAKDTQLENAIASANNLINSKANASDVYTKAEVLVELANYEKTSDADTKLAKKLNVTDAQNVYATKSELEDVKDASATKSEVNSALANKLNVTDAQNVYATKSQLEDVKDTAAKTVDVDAKLSSKLNIAEAQSTYATKEEVQDVKAKYATTEDLGDVNSQLNSRIDNNKESIDNIDFRFNNTTSELIYTDKNGNEHPFKLYGASLVKEGHFDAATNSIVLTIENAGVESKITIPVSELLSDLSGKIDVNAKAIEDINTELATFAKKWDVNSSSSVELTKTNDTLTAKVLIASGTRQALQSNENGLFVSNDLQDSTCVFGEEGTISGQDAISKLLASTTKMGQELEKKLNILDAQNTYATKTDLQSLDGKVETLKSEVTSQKSEISLIKKDVQSNKEGIVEAKESIKNVEGRVTSTENRLTAVESNISNLETRINSTEKEIADIKNDVKNITEVKLVELTNAINTLKATVEALTAPGGQVANLLAEISKIKTVTAYDTYTNTKNMSTRLDTLETEIGGGVAEELDNIKNNLIGPKDGSVAGSVWYELNNMVDAGTF